MQHDPTLPLPVQARSQFSAWRICAVAIGGSTIVLVPALTLVVAALTILVQAVLIVICNLPAVRRTGTALRDDETPGHASAPVLSIHIAARNEPPAVLIATLESLLRQTDAPEHEVIVMINNTPCAELWQPVEHWCHKAGRQFRLVRRDRVTGAKAGALNIALRQTRPTASHVVVLDADYQVVPGFLSVIAAELRRTGADFVQFPQAYRHLSPRTQGLSFELAEYFNRHARAANRADAMLLTGTLSVIRRDALATVGGWPSQSCTEDAELGTKLIAAGYRGVFIDRVVGRGLMPLDLRNLHGQRQRWAAGNARVLAGALRGWLGPGRDAGAGPLQRMLVVAQLAAWLNLGAVAVVTLLAAVVQAGFGRATGLGTAIPDTTILLSFATMGLILGATAWPILRAMLPEVPVSVRMQALASRMSMLPISACATIEGLQSKRQAFRVTAKVQPTAHAAQITSILSVTATLGLALVLVAVLSTDPVVAAAGLLLLLPPAGAWAIRKPLSRYAANVSEREG